METMNEKHYRVITIVLGVLGIILLITPYIIQGIAMMDVEEITMQSTTWDFSEGWSSCADWRESSSSGGMTVYCDNGYLVFEPDDESSATIVNADSISTSGDVNYVEFSVDMDVGFYYSFQVQISADGGDHWITQGYRGDIDDTGYWIWGDWDGSILCHAEVPSDKKGSNIKIKIQGSSQGGNKNIKSDFFKLRYETDNMEPTAFSGCPYSGDVGEDITFDGSSSYDNDGEITQYKWDKDNDGDWDATGVSPTVSYSSEGSYTVVLKVWDDDGATDMDTGTASIAQTNRPPVAEAGGPYDAYTNALFVADFCDSYDPDGTIVNYTVDLTNDGSTEVWGPDCGGFYISYKRPGTYTLELTVIDGEGATDTDTATVTVTDPPTVSIASTYSVVNVSQMAGMALLASAGGVYWRFL